MASKSPLYLSSVRHLLYTHVPMKLVTVTGPSVDLFLISTRSTGRQSSA